MTVIDTCCMCYRCKQGPQGTYQMEAHCLNCGRGDLSLLIRKGDKPVRMMCPTCGNWTVHADRLAADTTERTEPAERVGTEEQAKPPRDLPDGG